MSTEMNSTGGAGSVRRTDGDRLRAVLLRQALGTMLKPGPAGAKGLAQENWRAMLAEAIAEVASRGVDAGPMDARAIGTKATGARAAREATR